MKRALAVATFALGIAACDSSSTPSALSSADAPSAQPSAARQAAGSAAAAGSGLPSTAASAAKTAATKAPQAVTVKAADQRQLYYERPISKDDLKGRSLRELSLMRNTIYARAGNPFRRAWLKKHFAAKSWYRPLQKTDEKALTKLDRDNARVIAEYDAAIDRKELERRRDQLLKRRQSNSERPEDRIDLSLLSQRLGVWLGDERDGDPSPLEDPSRLDKLIKVSQLDDMSRRDLRILRNTIYARRGRRFASKVVRGYFSATAWYKPTRDAFDVQLTAVDQKNVAIVSSVEQSLGGPLHENPNYGKGDWFVMA